MSWPIISRSLSGKAASINYQFYNRALLPVGAFVAMLMAVTPLLAWRRKEGSDWKPGPLLKFGRQPRLPHPGVPTDHHHLPVAKNLDIQPIEVSVACA